MCSAVSFHGWEVFSDFPEFYLDAPQLFLDFRWLFFIAVIDLCCPWMFRYFASAFRSCSEISLNGLKGLRRYKTAARSTMFDD